MGTLKFRCCVLTSVCWQVAVGWRAAHHAFTLKKEKNLCIDETISLISDNCEMTTNQKQNLRAAFSVSAFRRWVFFSPCQSLPLRAIESTFGATDWCIPFPKLTNRKYGPGTLPSACTQHVISERVKRAGPIQGQVKWTQFIESRGKKTKRKNKMNVRNPSGLSKLVNSSKWFFFSSFSPKLAAAACLVSISVFLLDNWASGFQSIQLLKANHVVDYLCSKHFYGHNFNVFLTGMYSQFKQELISTFLSLTIAKWNALLEHVVSATDLTSLASLYIHNAIMNGEVCDHSS